MWAVGARFAVPGSRGMEPWSPLCLGAWEPGSLARCEPAGGAWARWVVPACPPPYIRANEKSAHAAMSPRPVVLCPLRPLCPRPPRAAQPSQLQQPSQPLANHRPPVRQPGAAAISTGQREGCVVIASTARAKQHDVGVLQHLSRGHVFQHPPMLLLAGRLPPLPRPLPPPETCHARDSPTAASHRIASLLPQALMRLDPSFRRTWRLAFSPIFDRSSLAPLDRLQVFFMGPGCPLRQSKLPAAGPSKLRIFTDPPHLVLLSASILRLRARVCVVVYAQQQSQPWPAGLLACWLAGIRPDKSTVCHS